MSNSIVQDLVVFAMEVFTIGSHTGQHTFWVCGLVKIHQSPIWIVLVRCEVTGCQVQRNISTKLAEHEWFHGAFWNLTREYLMQMLFIVHAILELIAAQPGQL